MSNFKQFRDEVERKLNHIAKADSLYRVNVAKDELWDAYLEAFPDGTNPMFRERTKHDCATCRHFIKNVGNVVRIKDGKLESVWSNIMVDEPYQTVAKELAQLIETAPIKEVFAVRERKFGNPLTRTLDEDGNVERWTHFSCEVPTKFTTDSIGETVGRADSRRNVFERGMRELSAEAIEIVEDLILQNSLYRGEEHKRRVQDFKKLKTAFDKLDDEVQKSIFIWENIKNPAADTKNTVIGTLIQDISAGMPLVDAVNAFESKVAPTNYKRSSAPITKGMIKKAMETIDKLGLRDSLARRMAVPSDLSVNNVLFVDRNVAGEMKDSLESMLMEEVKVSEKDFGKVEEIDIDDFMTNVLPKASSIELMLEGKHVKNLVTITAPQHPDAPPLFKWDNPYAWSYNGNIADSDIKERVKAAGGSVTGDLRISLSWYNTDDLDIHLYEPSGGEHVHFGRKRSQKSGAELDVDMNVNNPVRDAVENITWPDRDKILKGKHVIGVHNYTSRESTNVGFEIEVEYNGEIQTYSYDKKVRGGTMVKVFEFWVENGELVIKPLGDDIKCASRSQDVWGMKTNEFQKVSMVMLSPNYWDGQEVGNKHHMFMLEKAHNDEPTRGFYNEFLRNDLTEHRKVFEVLADKTMCEPSDVQLSGVGFSSTQRNDIIVKVSVSFNRVLKIKF